MQLHLQLYNMALSVRHLLKDMQSNTRSIKQRGNRAICVIDRPLNFNFSKSKGESGLNTAV